MWSRCIDIDRILDYDPVQMSSESKCVVATLRPEGSANDFQFPVEKRVIMRPEINYWKASLNVLVPPLVCLGICLWDVRFALLALCVYALVRLRGMTIWCIRVYQKHAPEHVRQACVFEPSCSEYMILSIEKYGVVRGIAKGVNRLKRCGHPNGGEDFP